MERATPVMLLYLQHPSTGVATAAHALFCGLVQAAPPGLRDALGRAYLERALVAYPAATPAAPLALALDTLARALPACSPASPHAARQVASRAVELLREPQQWQVRKALLERTPLVAPCSAAVCQCSEYQGFRMIEIHAGERSRALQHSCRTYEGDPT